MTIYPVYVRGGQSARDDINDVIHTQLLYIIDRSVIILTRYAMMYASNHACNHCRVKHYLLAVLQLRTMPDWMLQQAASGEGGLRGHFLM